MSAAPAFSQTTTAGGAAADDEAIVVTGSRIARRDLESAAPFAVIGQEEFRLTGTINVENVINALPQVVPGITAFSNNPGGGVATLNLRGLGAARTMVLVNGRRWMFYSTNQVVDLNTIPTFLIESTDVVTGGASAVYGSDAISGVVNFRLKNVEGFEGNVTNAITEAGDGNRFDANLAFGGSFGDGRGKATVFASFSRRNAIFAGDRAFSETALADSNPPGGFVSGGSGATPQGGITVPGTNVFRDPSFPALPTGTTCTTVPTPAGCNVLPLGVGSFGTALGGTFPNAAGSSRPFTAADLYNYAPVNYLMVPQERYLFGGYAEYEITPGVTAYTELSYVNNRVKAQLAATPVTGTFNIRLATVAPFLSAQDNALLAQIDANETAINARRQEINAANAAAGSTATPLPLLYGPTGIANGAGVISTTLQRRVTDINARINNDDSQSFRTLFGLRGDIGETGLNYDAYYSYSRNRNSNIQLGNVSRSAFQRGLDGSGTAIDIFGENTLTPAMASAISITAQNTTISTLEVASGSVSGTLFNLGFGGDDIGFAVGTEWRRMGSEFIPDTALSSGDVIGFNATNPTSGQYSVKEVFGEVRLPIAADRPFFYNLELTGAGRYSDYSLPTVGGVWTFAVGGQWAPIQDLMFRGQFSRAIRAPNVGELFGGGGIGFPAATDPCSTPAAAAAGALRNTCIATGAPAGNLGLGIPSQLQLNQQIQNQTGGNPNLNAEEADTYTFGAVIRPSFVPRFSVTVDYFNVKIGNAIATAGGGAANILNLCYNVFQDANNGFCQLVSRNPSTGALDGSTNPDGSRNVVFAGVANLSSLNTSGIDLGVNYDFPLSFGLVGAESNIAFSFLGTWTETNSFTPVIGRPELVECAGRFGTRCTPQSKWKHNARLSWNDGGLTTSLRWRYLGPVVEDNDTLLRTVERIGAYNLFDLSFSYQMTDNVGFNLGVNNLLNRQPPIVGTGQEQSNTFPGVYDVLGRDFFISANFRF
nr:TonB-dependent receptor [Polymorphobacter multimanifer]